ncbi:MAG: AraC family transcriptional regulator, partial [Bacteroidota bacterium]
FLMGFVWGNFNMEGERIHLEQLATQMGLSLAGSTLSVPSNFGAGALYHYPILDGIDVYHYHVCLSQPIVIQSYNPVENGCYLMNVNLSPLPVEKEVRGEQIKIGHTEPAGVIFYTPGTRAQGTIPLHVMVDLVFVSFTLDSLKAIYPVLPVFLSDHKPFSLYEELTPASEHLLRQALTGPVESLMDKLYFQARIFQFMGQVFEYLSQRDQAPTVTLRAEDLTRLFKVRELLRQHILGKAPDIHTLATLSGVSTSKLKQDFRAFFGQSIYQYYLGLKMETAKNRLLDTEETVSELGYQLGYSNISQFIRAFKKYVGETPNHFRQARQQV